VYVKLLSQELAAMGHRVDVWSGPPYPELAPHIRLVEVPSLDLWKGDKVRKVPTIQELRDPIDRLEYVRTMMGEFPEMKTFLRRVDRAFMNVGDEDDVALYLHDKLYSLSVQHGIEIGARIFRVDSGWSFTLPRTDFKSHEVYAGPVPPGAIGGTAGDWHTHPSGNSFSGMDRHNATFASERDGRTSYVSHMMDGRAVLSQIYFYRPNALTWIGGKWQ
jgi:hypothetical protein